MLEPYEGKPSRTVLRRESGSNPADLAGKINSVTKEGIYGVKFLVYDQNKNPIGEYTTDDNSYIYIDDLTVQGKGRLYIRELEAAQGYELDKEYKTVYVQPGKTIEIEWENTPITGQFQIHKYAAEANPVTGDPADQRGPVRQGGGLHHHRRQGRGGIQAPAFGPVSHQRSHRAALLAAQRHHL